MDIGNMKNVVILKNLPSNIVEEAIVLLKQNQKVKKPEYIEIKNKELENKQIDNSKDYIVKEAQMLIADYVSKLEKTNKDENKNTIKLKNKYKISKAINVILAITICILCF